MRHALAIIAAVAALTGCEQPLPENPYEPGGKFVQQLDARGRRHLVYDRDGQVIAKLRALPTKTKVYSAQMQLLGTVEAGDELAVRRGQSTPTRFEQDGDAVVVLPGTLRIERVDSAWAVFDHEARRLGYFEWLADGRLALRDDYSSPPRAFGGTETEEARTPAGQMVVRAAPPYPPAALLPFALEGGLDALDRFALGQWLMRQAPPEPEKPLK